jgi:hypothetical protein
MVIFWTCSGFLSPKLFECYQVYFAAMSAKSLKHLMKSVSRFDSRINVLTKSPGNNRRNEIIIKATIPTYPMGMQTGPSRANMETENFPWLYLRFPRRGRPRSVHSPKHCPNLKLPIASVFSNGYSILGFRFSWAKSGAC